MTDPTLAYLDPGTGSMLLQIIAGGVAAVGVSLKMFWRRLPFVGRKRAEQETGSDS
jgi:hypothetical protein